MEEEDREMDNEENRDPEVPNFAHIGPTVRKKEERKKLLGFDCKECQDYYQGKLKDGYTKDQIVQMMNDCSRHRGLFKPPLTPDKFWDPLMVEDDTQDPRNKTQEAPPLRRRREDVARRLAAPAGQVDEQVDDHDLKIEMPRRQKDLRRPSEKDKDIRRLSEKDKDMRRLSEKEKDMRRLTEKETKGSKSSFKKTKADASGWL